MVRAPACHAGGCEFKPRLSREKALSKERAFRFCKFRFQIVKGSLPQFNTQAQRKCMAHSEHIISFIDLFVLERVHLHHVLETEIEGN